MNSKMKRDSKDPMPEAKHSHRLPPDGNTPTGKESHGQKKAERVAGSQRFTLRSGNEKQPPRFDGRHMGGNTPVTGEDHKQKKGERVTGRGGQNVETTAANPHSPGR